jgi:putative holliday junction resolvase
MLPGRASMTKQDEIEMCDGPVLALDLGQRRVGIAVSDSLKVSITRLSPLKRTNWKQLLQDVTDLIRRFDAKTLVIGLPLSLDGATGPAAIETERTAEKFARSLDLPVYLQDERLTSVEATERLHAAGHNLVEIERLVDSEAAAIILADFIPCGQQRLLVSRPLVRER